MPLSKLDILLAGKAKGQERILLIAAKAGKIRLGNSGWADSLVRLGLLRKEADTYHITDAGYFAASIIVTREN